MAEGAAEQAFLMILPPFPHSEAVAAISEQLQESFRLTGTSLDDSTLVLSYAIVYPDSVILLP